MTTTSNAEAWSGNTKTKNLGKKMGKNLNKIRSFVESTVLVLIP